MGGTAATWTLPEIHESIGKNLNDEIMNGVVRGKEVSIGLSGEIKINDGLQKHFAESINFAKTLKNISTDIDWLPKNSVPNSEKFRNMKTEEFQIHILTSSE